MEAIRDREFATPNCGTSNSVPVRAEGGFVKLSDRLLASILNKDKRVVSWKKKVASKNDDAWEKYLAAKKLSEERSRILSICIEIDLSLLISQFHISPVPRPTSRKHSRQAKGLCIFDTSAIEERWGPHFHKFPELPTELRLKIWQFALPRKRVLPIKEKEMDIAVGYYTSPCQVRVLYGANSTFPVLHVNFEARQEALRFYKLPFGNGLTYRPNVIKTYLDPAFDTVFFGHNDDINFADCLSILSMVTIKNITSIALSMRICEELAFYFSWSGYQADSTDLQAKENLCNIKTAYCISGQDPTICMQDFVISECTCGSVGSLATEEVEVLNHFLGVELRCGEIVKH